MAAQKGAHVAVMITPSLSPHIEQGERSPPASSLARGTSFVKSIDRKARNYLKTLERSFSFSGGESRDEDTSSMTIEFLKTRLQAQRAEYKAEKHKSQQLAKKVLELEQRLKSEIERRRIVEHNNAMLPPRYSSKLRSFRSFNERMELSMPENKFRESSSGGEHSDYCSEISAGEDGVFLISPSSLRHQSQVLGREHQQMAYPHECFLTKDTNEASIVERIREEKPRNIPFGVSKCEFCASPLGPKPSADLENTNTTFDTWNTKDYKDQQSSEVMSTFEDLTLKREEPPTAEHFVLQNRLHGQPRTFLQIDNHNTSEGAHYINVPKETMPQPINLVKPIICKNCQNHTSLAGGTRVDNLSSQKGVYAQNSQTTLKVETTPEFGETGKTGSLKGTNLGQNQTHESISAHSTTNKDEMDNRATLETAANSEFVKAILPLDVIRSLRNHDVSLVRLRNPEKIPYPCKKNIPNPYRFPSSMLSNHGERLRECRMSLDGGLDRLQEVRYQDRRSSSRQSMS